MGKSRDIALAFMVFLLAGCVSAPPSEAERELPRLVQFLERAPVRHLEPRLFRGTSERIPWNSGFWPDAFGGIARRWQTDVLADAVYYGVADAKRLSHEELRRLSPAEKWDLLRGDATFSTVRETREGGATLSPAWAGLCTGVALASLTYEEPAPVEVALPDGGTLPLGSADVKAILSYLEQRHVGKTVIRFGERCDAFEPRSPSPECNDLSAASFHQALTELIGRRREPFIADTSWDAQVWNHVFYAYEMKSIGRRAPSAGEPRGTVRVETMVATVSANSYRVPEQWEPFGEQGRKDVEKLVYHYELLLGKGDVILGSRWLSYEKPDYLWRRKGVDLAELEPALRQIRPTRTVVSRLRP